MGGSRLDAGLVTSSSYRLFPRDRSSVSVLSMKLASVGFPAGFGKHYECQPDSASSATHVILLAGVPPPARLWSEPVRRCGNPDQEG